MVKSPWRLLTALLSREKTADQHNVGQTNLTEILDEVEHRDPGANSQASEASKGVESAPEAKPSAALHVGVAQDGDHQDPSPLIAVEVPDVMPIGEAPAFAPDRTVAIIGAKRRDPQGEPSSTTRRKTKVQAPVRTRDVDRAIAMAERVAPNEPDPIRALNSDIRVLRSQLTVKLRLQNDQLRQMLSRFEPK